MMQPPKQHSMHRVPVVLTFYLEPRNASQPALLYQQGISRASAIAVSESFQTPNQPTAHHIQNKDYLDSDSLQSRIGRSLSVLVHFFLIQGRIATKQRRT